MPRTLLRTVVLLLVTAIVFSPGASFGRGPSGRGGPGGGAALAVPADTAVSWAKKNSRKRIVC